MVAQNPPGKPSRPQKSHEASGKQPELQKAPENSAGKLNRFIHGRMRLGIVSALAVNESLTFNELKKLTDASDGNPSVHARKLEEAEYIVCTKSFVGRKPQTQYRLTHTGRKALEKYLAQMEALIQATRRKRAKG